MAVRRYHNKWRAVVRGLDGVELQKYFDEEADAYDFIEAHHKARNEAVGKRTLKGNWKKKSGSKHPDLPVGFYQGVQFGRGYESNFIRCIPCFDNTHIKALSVYITNSRSREEAIELLLKKREEFIKSFHHLVVQGVPGKTIYHYVRLKKAKSIAEIKHLAALATNKRPKEWAEIEEARDLVIAELK